MTSSTLTDALGDHARHVFIFSSAGKPIFSRYGGKESETPLAALYGTLLVLMEGATADGRLERVEMAVPPHHLPCPTTRTPGALMERAPAPHIHNGAVEPPASPRAPRGRPVRVTIYFERVGQLRYVMVVRRHPAASASPPTPPTAEVGRMADEALCRAQLRYCHLALLSAVPTMNDILSRSPGYDARALLSPADADLLRELLDSAERAPSAMAADAVPARVPGALARARRAASSARDGVDLTSIDHAAVGHTLGAVLRTHCTTAGPGAAAAEETVVLALALHRADGEAQARVLAAVDRSTALCQGARITEGDVLVLTHFVLEVLRRQPGEVWAPIALPGFNATGYVWCHCCRASVWGTAAGGAGLALAQVSLSAENFTALSTNARRVVEAVAAVRLAEVCLPTSLATGGDSQGAVPPQEGEGGETSLLSLFPDASQAGGRTGEAAADAAARERVSRELWGRIAPGATPPRSLLARLVHYQHDLFSGRPARAGGAVAGAHPALAAVVHLHAVVAAAPPGPLQVRGGASNGLHHWRRDLSLGEGSVTGAALVAAARAHGASPFTIMEARVPEGALTAAEAEPAPRRLFRVLLLTDLPSPALLSQLCLRYYRNPARGSGQQQQQQRVGAGGEGAAPLTAPCTYAFSGLLSAMKQGRLAEVGVVVDASLSLEESWFCVMRFLHSLLM